MPFTQKFGIKQADDPLVPPRRVQIGAFGDMQFEVAVAYSASMDAFVAHPYVVNRPGQKTKVGTDPLHAADERLAFTRAWAAIDHWLGK